MERSVVRNTRMRAMVKVDPFEAQSWVRFGKIHDGQIETEAEK